MLGQPGTVRIIVPDKGNQQDEVEDSLPSLVNQSITEDSSSDTEESTTDSYPEIN